MDLPAANQLGPRSIQSSLPPPRSPPTATAYIFLDPRAPSFHLDWDHVANVQLTTDTGLMVFAYCAEPGTRSGPALDPLANWAATPAEAELPQRTGEA